MKRMDFDSLQGLACWVSLWFWRSSRWWPESYTKEREEKKRGGRSRKKQEPKEKIVVGVSSWVEVAALCSAFWKTKFEVL